MRFFRSLILTGFLLITFGPFLWLTISSLKINRELFANPFGLPEKWMISNYVSVFSSVPIPRYFINSLYVSVLSTLITLAVASLAAYIFTFRFKGKTGWILLVTIGILIPTNAFMVPYYYIINWLGFYDSLVGVSLIYTGMMLPFTLIIIKNYMDSLPHEMKEAAYIDGASIHRCFFSIVLPVSTPSLFTAAIFLIISAWNELLFANLLTQSEGNRTLQVAIRFFLSQFHTDYPKAFAAMMIVIMPTVIIYSLLSEKIIGGLTAGAVK
jgi:raffinose/stachyose/melibiose transport system permease protein